MLHFANVLFNRFDVLILLNEAGAFQVCADSKLLLFFFALSLVFFVIRKIFTSAEISKPKLVTIELTNPGQILFITWKV